MLILARHLSFKFFFEAESLAMCSWACFLHILRSCQDPAGEVLVTDHLSHLPLTSLSDSPGLFHSRRYSFIFILWKSIC